MKGTSKCQWTPKEDELLLQLVEKYGKNWSTIATNFKNRVSKQCRERYLNHIDPSIKSEWWSAEEDELIINWHEKHGNQWSAMANKLEGRPPNSIKNHWNSTLKRAVAKVKKDVRTSGYYNVTLPRCPKKFQSQDNPAQEAVVRVWLNVNRLDTPMTPASASGKRRGSKKATFSVDTPEDEEWDGEFTAPQRTSSSPIRTRRSTKRKRNHSSSSNTQNSDTEQDDSSLDSDEPSKKRQKLGNAEGVHSNTRSQSNAGSALNSASANSQDGVPTKKLRALNGAFVTPISTHIQASFKDNSMFQENKMDSQSQHMMGTPKRHMFPSSSIAAPSPASMPTTQQQPQQQQPHIVPKKRSKKQEDYLQMRRRECLKIISMEDNFSRWTEAFMELQSHW